MALRPLPSRLRPAALFLGVFAGYAALARGGLQLVDPTSGIASFWPPNGLVVAALVLTSGRSRLAVAAAVLPGELVADALQGSPPFAALGWGLANLVESVLAALLLASVARRRPRGDTQRDFVALALAAVTAPAVGGLLGAWVSVLAYGGSFVHAWVTWWPGDTVGILLVVPLVLGAARRGRRSVAARLVGVGELVLVVGVALLVFGAVRGPLEFLVLAPLVLIAVRQGLLLTALASLGFSLVASLLTARGHGPIDTMAPGHLRVLSLQAFIATTAFVGFLVTATIAERREAEARYLHLAGHDPLTGLPNRRLFMEHVERLTARAGRSLEPVGILYFDLDGFKQVNDRLGHQAGDRVLAEVAHRLSAQLRQGDVVARLGGDEFAALLDPVADLEAAEEVLARLVAATEGTVEVGGGRAEIRLSAGAALLQGMEADAALRSADAELYRAKSRRPAPAAR